MRNHPQRRDPLPFRVENEIDEVLSQANPNPGRVGCPPRSEIVALARRQRPMGDPGYEHVVKCSPCYRDFRAVTQGAAVDESAAARWRRWWPAVAAVILVAALAGWWAFAVRSDRNGGPSQAAIRGEQRVELDLRKYVVTRSARSEPESPPLLLPAAPTHMILFLPVGAMPGEYQLQVLDADQGARAAAAGQAEIRNYVTTLEVRVDLGTLAGGAYQLAIRREGEEWHLYPAEVK